MDAIKQAVSSDSCCPDCSLKTRAIGFFVTSALAGIFSFLAIMNLASVLNGSAGTFIIYNSIGVSCSIAASFFWKGPKAQWAVITDAKRIIPALVFVICFILSFIFWFALKHQVLTIVAIACQMIAGGIYLFSFIPGGFFFFKYFCKQVCKCDEETDSGDGLL